MALLLRRLDVDVSRRETAFAHFLNFELDRQSERVDAGADRLGIDAGVDERRQRHVTADAAETVEMSNAHRSPPRFGHSTTRRGICSIAVRGSRCASPANLLRWGLFRATRVPFRRSVALEHGHPGSGRQTR